MMNTILMIVSLTFIASAVPAEAKNKNKSVVGCVEQRQGAYELSTTSKKGKAKHYALVGAHDFARDVGHWVKVNGVVEHKKMNAGSVSTISSRCKQQ